MNLLLIEAEEINHDGSVVLMGRRAQHLLSVLRVEVGQTVRAGVLDGPYAEAQVLSLDPAAVSVTVACSLSSEASAPPRDVLLLAVPRPKVLLRMLSAAASLGYEHVILFRTWRVDKSHLDARSLDSSSMRQALLHGLEQSRRTQLPRVTLEPLFKPFVEDRLDDSVPRGHRFVAHPTAPDGTWELAAIDGPFTLVLGPEGGLIPFEVEALAERGFRPVHCGPYPLRTETALGVLSGQLQLLRDRGTS